MSHRIRPTPRLLAAGALAATLAAVPAACSSDDASPGTPTGPSATPVQAASVEAAATANTFTPPTVRLSRGGTVTWSFGARPHNVTFDAVTGAPENVLTTTDGSAARTFATAGTFTYHCTLHSGMSGTIVVP